MRSGRSLLVLLVVALGLGAYIYFVESRRDPAATERKDKLFAVEADDITELDVRTTAGGTTSLRKADDGWTLTAPVTASADTSNVEALVSSLANAEIDRVLEENATDLAPFGLATPVTSITFRTAGGTGHQLHVGSTTPTSSGVYARVDDSARVLLIPAYLARTFDKTPFDLRNRQALAVDRTAIDRVAIAARGAAPLELRRDGVTWRLAAPIDARADYGPADSLMGRLTSTQMSSIVSEGSDPTPAQLRRYGLDAPQLVATAGTGSASASLALGGTHDEASIYARDLARPQLVFTVDASVLADLRKTADDLRMKDIFDLNAFSAQTLELTHGATALAYSKSAPTEGDDSTPTWSRTKPEAGEANQTAITDLLNTLSSLRAERFVAQAPAGGDDLVVAASYGSSDAVSEERVTLRRSGQTVYAVRAGEPGAAVIPSAQFETVLSQLKTLAGAE